MSTAQALIKQALRRIGAVGEGDVPSGDQDNDALTELNQLLSDLQDFQVPIGDGSLTLSSTVAVDVSDERNIVWLLCEQLLVEYPSQNAALIAAKAIGARTSLINKYITVGKLDVDPALLKGPFFDINTG